jgi:hypothetical protein
MNANFALLAAGLVLAGSVAAQTLYKYRHPDGRIEYSNKVLRGAVLLEAIQAPAPAPAPRAAPAPAPRGLSPGERSQAATVDRNVQQRVSAREAAWLELRQATTALAAAEARLAAGLEPLPGEAGALAGSVPIATIDPNVPQTPALSPSEAVGGPGGPQIGGAAPVASFPEPKPPAPAPAPRRERDPVGPDAPKLKPQPPAAGAEGTPPPAPKPNPLAERPPGRDTTPVAPTTPPGAEVVATAPTPPASPAIGGPQAAVTPAAGGSLTGRRGGGRSAEYQIRISRLEMDVAVARSRVDAAQAAYNRLR